MNMIKLRLEGKLPVYRVAICLILLVVPGCGASQEFNLHRLEVCESEDANLLFPNTPTSYAGDIKAKTWNKDNGIRLASWMASSDFITNPSYGDRLMSIGENSIKIRNATRNDTGFYTLVQTSGSTQNFLKSTIYLEVLVPPTNQCIPNITHEGDSLWAILPLEGCGIPKLTPNWTSGTQKLINDRISVLDLTSGINIDVYIVCAVGNSKRCIPLDSSSLCKNHTVSEPRIKHNSNTGLILWWIPVLIVIIIIIGTGAGMFYCKRIKNKNKHPDDSRTENETGERITLMDQGIRDAKRHLIGQYKNTMSVAISPCHEENLVDVSHVFCELEIRSLQAGEDKIRENVTTANVLFSSIGAESVRPIPVMIIGECGSGKTTWCKNLVHQWCQYHDNNESNSNMKDFNIPDIARFEIILYIQLKKKLEDSSFMEHVRHTLFANAANYYEYTMRYILEHRESVLFLIDGLDEVTSSLDPIVNLLKEEETFPCSIVLTSRPSGLEVLQEKYEKSFRSFEINGMSLEGSKEYARKVLDVLCRTAGVKLNVDQFWKFANQIQVLSMCHIPFMCLSLILIWIESKAISADVTDVLLMIVEYYLRRAMNREWYKANIYKVLKQQQIDISDLIPRAKNAQYLRDHGYLLKVISNVAQNVWYERMDSDIDKKSIERESETIDIGNDVTVCLQTGILLKTFRNTLEKTRSQIIFSHPLLFDLFVALSIALEKGEPFRRCITTKNSVIENICMINMLCQIAPNVGQKLISDISKIFEKGNEKDEESEHKFICTIECNDPKCDGGEPVKWLMALMYVDELSNAKLSILTEGLKFTKDITAFFLELSENKNELVFRLPLLSKLQELHVDIENCTLVLHKEKDWNKGNCSDLGKLVIKSVNIDVKTAGSIIEAVCTCKHLHSLELCPNDAQILAISNTKTFYGWGHLAECVKDMTKLSTVRLHNLQIRAYLPALLESLCKCPTIEILDLMNVKEIDAKETLKVSAKYQDLYGCKRQEAKQSENSKMLKIVRNKTCKLLQLINNAMSEKSWLALSMQLECLSPLTVHIEQVHQSSRVVNEVLQGIGKCKYLKMLTISNVQAGIHPLSFYSLKQLHKLKKFTLSKITMPDSSWKELSDILARLEKLGELSFAYLDIQNCFIEVHKSSKLKLIEMREVHLEDGLWSKLVDEVMMLPNLETLELVSCKMSYQTSLSFSDKMNNSSFHVEMEKKSKLADSEMVSIDMIATPKRK